MEILDPAALDNLRGTGSKGTKLLPELIAMFLEDTSSLLDELRQGVEQRETAVIQQVAHNLKSSCAMFGATILANLCQELEMMEEADTLDEAAKKMAQIEVEYEQVKAALEAVQRAELAEMSQTSTDNLPFNKIRPESSEDTPDPAALE